MAETLRELAVTLSLDYAGILIGYDPGGLHGPGLTLMNDVL